MTTDPIAAALALIADAINFACAANHHLAGQDPEQAQQWRDALATLTDAQAALDKLLAEARREGWRAGRDAAADEAALYSCSEGVEDFTKGVNEGYTDAVTQIVDGIRAMPEPKETNHD